MTALEVLAGEIVPAAGGELANVDGDPAGRLVVEWLTAVCRSDDTYRAYRGDIGEWLVWLEQCGVGLLEASRSHVDAWARVMERTPSPRTGRPLAKASRARRIATVASFYGYAHDVGAVERQPVTKRARPSVPNVSTTTGLSRDEARRLLARLEHESVRDRAIVRVLLLDGLRVGELLGLNVGAMRPREGRFVLTVHGKGDKRRDVVMAPSAVTAVESWLEQRAAAAGVARVELDDEWPMFVNLAGGPLTQRAVTRIVQRIARAAGIASHRDLSPHSLRHACATAMLDAGVALHVVRDQLGHSKSETTERYDRARGTLARSGVYALEAFLSPEGE